MKKSVIAVILILALLLCPTSAFASGIPNAKTTPGARNIAILYMTNDFSIDGDGKTTCDGRTQVLPAYTAGVKIELQRLVGGDWTTIKTWEAEGSPYAGLYKHWYVTSGYYYQLYLTHTAKTSGGTTIETLYTSSHVIFY